MWRHVTLEYSNNIKKRKTRGQRYLPNINRTQAAEMAESAVFVPGDLDL